MHALAALQRVLIKQPANPDSAAISAVCTLLLMTDIAGTCRHECHGDDHQSASPQLMCSEACWRRLEASS